MGESNKSDIIFSLLPENYFILSSEFKITQATNYLLKSLNLKSEELVGLSIFELFPEIPKSIIHASLEKDRTNSYQSMYGDKNWDITIFRIKEDEESSHTFCKLTNIEKPSVTKADPSLIYKITDSFPGIIALYNFLSGEYIYINKSVENILGHEREEILIGGMDLVISMIHPDDVEKLMSDNQRLINAANKEYPDYDDSKVASFEYRIKTKENTYKWVQTYGIIFKRNKDNKVEQILNVSIDITERKEYELKIQQSEQRLNELKDTLEEKVKEGEEELLKNEAYYQFMANVIPGILWTAKPSGEMEYYSKSWEEYTGISNEDAIKGDWAYVLHPNDADASFKAIQKALETGTEYKIEHRIKDKDGNYRWFLSRALPLKDKNDTIIKWFGTSFDIDEEKNILQQLEISKTKYQFLADSIPQIIYTTAPNGKVDYLNKRWYEFTGIDSDDLDLNTISDTIHKDDKEKLEKTYAHSIQTGEPFKIEFRLRKYTGEYRWFLGRAIPMKNHNGDIVKWFGSSTDIQEQKETIEHLAQIERDLSITNDALSQKNGELNKINVDLDNFIYTASHDLKAPISNIEGLTNMLKDIESSNDDEIKSILDLMEKSTERFKKTIATLTDVAKVQKNINDDIEEISFNEIYEEVVQDIEDIDETKAIIKTHFNKAKIHCSKKNLRSIFYNLISNAIRYRDPDRRPEIEITTETTKNYTTLTIQDNGIGIEKRNQDKVFKMFKRLHHHTEGTGIGLYIVKRIIDNAGGKIEIDSEVNKGTKFTLYFKNHH